MILELNFTFSRQNVAERIDHTIRQQEGAFPFRFLRRTYLFPPKNASDLVFSRLQRLTVDNLSAKQVHPLRPACRPVTDSNAFVD